MPPSSQAAYQSLKDYESNRVTPDAATSQGEQKYGVSGLGSQLSSLRAVTGNLEQSIKNVDPSVTGRTSGSLVTEAQRARIVNQERTPLMEQYGTATRNVADTQGAYDRATGLASNYANELMGNDKNVYDRLFGQYTSALGSEQQQRDEAYRQAQAAESKRQFDTQTALAHQKASAGNGGLNLAGLLGGAAAAPAPAPTAQDHLAADIQKLLPADYATKFNDGYTERLIDRLRQAYPEVPPAQIAQQVYAYRKPFEKR